jgi:hypothetical protein
MGYQKDITTVTSITKMAYSLLAMSAWQRRGSQFQGPEVGESDIEVKYPFAHRCRRRGS